MFRSLLTHTHLDWHEASEWLDFYPTAPIRLGWHNHRLAGLIAASVPLNRTCWLRLIAVEESSDTLPILTTLWNDLSEELRQHGVETTAVLIINDWLLDVVGHMGFSYDEHIVTLRRANRLPPPPSPFPLTIRSAGMDDVEPIIQVDDAAFPPPWQMATSDLRQAQRIAASCTVALRDSQIIGYQLSTFYRDSAHLARLAVSPTQQGIGIGAALLGDVIQRFLKRGVQIMTVNTQQSNVRSQHLYLRYGFQRNGYDLPVWLASL